MLRYAAEKEKEETLWSVWVQIYPHFTEETFIPFSEFKTKVFGTPMEGASNISFEEVSDIMEEVVAKYEKQKGG